MCGDRLYSIVVYEIGQIDILISIAEIEMTSYPEFTIENQIRIRSLYILFMKENNYDTLAIHINQRNCSELLFVSCYPSEAAL